MNRQENTVQGRGLLVHHASCSTNSSSGQSLRHPILTTIATLLIWRAPCKRPGICLYEPASSHTAPLQGRLFLISSSHVCQRAILACIPECVCRRLSGAALHAPRAPCSSQGHTLACMFGQQTLVLAPPPGRAATSTLTSCAYKVGPACPSALAPNEHPKNGLFAGREPCAPRALCGP